MIHNAQFHWSSRQHVPQQTAPKIRHNFSQVRLAQLLKQRHRDEEKLAHKPQRNHTLQASRQILFKPMRTFRRFTYFYTMTLCHIARTTRT